MKKFVSILIAFVCLFSFAACTAASSPAYTSPWGEGNVYENTVYDVVRERANKTSSETKYEQVAKGTQSVTVRETKDTAYENCIELVVDRSLTYTQDDKISDTFTIPKGTVDTYYSKVIFSIATKELMKVKYAEKKVVSAFNTESNPVNLDYTAAYDSGLKITDKLQNNKVISYGSKAVGNAIDNEMWILLVRYASGFGKGWTGNLNLLSIADTIYTGKLTTFSMTAKAATDGIPNFWLPSLTSNVVLGADQVFELVADSTDRYCTKTGEPALNVSLSQGGSFGTNKGPAIKATFLTGRSVQNKIPLANMMLYYEQSEFSTNGTPLYRNTVFLSGASITATV